MKVETLLDRADQEIKVESEEAVLDLVKAKKREIRAAKRVVDGLHKELVDLLDRDVEDVATDIEDGVLYGG